MRRLLPYLLCLSCVVAAPAASAAKLPPIINTGDEMFEVADFSPEHVATYPDLKDYKLAYKCNRFGLFWADVWTWDCGLVAGQIEANAYADLPPELLAPLSAEYPISRAKRGVWNHYGVPIMLAVLAGGVLLGRMRRSS